MGAGALRFGPRFFLLLLMGVCGDLGLLRAALGVRDAGVGSRGFAGMGVDLLHCGAEPTESSTELAWSSGALGSIGSGNCAGQWVEDLLHAVALDAVPIQLRSAPAELELSVAGGREASKTYAIRASQRGAVTLGDVYVRYQSVFRIAERWVRVPLEQRVGFILTWKRPRTSRFSWCAAGRLKWRSTYADARDRPGLRVCAISGRR